MEKYYTGIGSRNAPQWARKLAYDLAIELVNYGYILRSGAAEGMDESFEKGCDAVGGEKEIYLPWRRFNNHPSDYYSYDNFTVSVAMDLHPAWGELSQGARKLHTRNVPQIVGDWQTPSRFVLCYTPWDRGGTLQALRLANKMGIQIVNFWDFENEKHQVRTILNKVLVKKYQLKTKLVIDPYQYDFSHKSKAHRFIHGFRGKYRFMSNFFMAEYILNNKTYYYIENGFQSYKTDPPDERIRVAGNPETAKILGRKVQLRPDWEQIKDEIMYKHVYAKFHQNDHLRQMLIETNQAYLSEDNTWHDNYWGDCTCDDCQLREGKNMLGKILMRVRDELKREGKAFY